MHLRKSTILCQLLIVTAALAAAGMAQGQTFKSGGVNDSANGTLGRIDAGSRWGRGLELSESGTAQRNRSIGDENMFVLRDARGSSIAEYSAGSDYRMSLGYRVLWSLDTDSVLSAPNVEPDERAIYYTLRYDDIRLGLSYHPGTRRGPESSAEINARPGTGGIRLGADYDRAFEGFGVGVSAGYAPTDASEDLANPDMDSWSVGARFDLGRLQVFAGFQSNDNPQEISKQLAASGWDETWNLGARYRWGRNDVSLAYAYGENRPDYDKPGDDKLDTATLSYIRQLDGGVQWSINLYWADHDGHVTRREIDRDGTALSTAIRLSF